jgi:hypothetical protein
VARGARVPTSSSGGSEQGAKRSKRTQQDARQSERSSAHARSPFGPRFGPTPDGDRTSPRRPASRCAAPVIRPAPAAVGRDRPGPGSAAATDRAQTPPSPRQSRRQRRPARALGARSQRACRAGGAGRLLARPRRKRGQAACDTRIACEAVVRSPRRDRSMRRRASGSVSRIMRKPQSSRSSKGRGRCPPERGLLVGLVKRAGEGER